MTTRSETRAAAAAEAESIAAGEAAVDAPPPPPQTKDEKIAELEAKLNLLMEMATRPGGAPLYPEHVAAVISPQDEEIIPGSTVRPSRGPLHLTTGKPVFNGARPTGRTG